MGVCTASGEMTNLPFYISCGEPLWSLDVMMKETHSQARKNQEEAQAQAIDIRVRGLLILSERERLRYNRWITIWAQKPWNLRNTRKLIWKCWEFQKLSAPSKYEVLDIYSIFHRYAQRWSFCSFRSSSFQGGRRFVCSTFVDRLER